jgi:hypothetical protein
MFLPWFTRCGLLFDINSCSLSPALQKVENWFQNNRPKNTQKAKPKKDDHSLLGQWTVRKVVQHTMKKQIDALIAENNDEAQPGSEDYIKSYQRICSEVVKNLTPAQRAECESLVEEWNSTGPDATTKAQ